MIVPDCRTDEAYNEKYLNDRDKEFVSGYDWAVREIAESFFSNLEIYPELEKILMDNMAIIMNGKADILKDCITDFLEMQRNELITSMLDSYSEEEYGRLKKKADK